MKLSELSEATGVSPRSIKRYIHERLLAPPEGRTRSARYSDAHRRDLLRIESLRAAGLSLDDIRQEFLPRPAPNEGSTAKPDSAVESSVVEYRYKVADGIYIVFASMAEPRDLESQAAFARRCRALVKS